MLLNLIKWQEENGYKSKWVAEKLGISESAYCKIKKGVNKPSIELAYKFQEVFEIDDVLELLRKF